MLVVDVSRGTPGFFNKSAHLYTTGVEKHLLYGSETDVISTDQTLCPDIDAAGKKILLLPS